MESCAGKTLNIGNQDVELSIGELAQMILTVTGKPLRINAGPETQGSPSRRCPDMTLTTSLTGYRPSIDLREGVERTYDWYRKNVFDGNQASAK